MERYVNLNDPEQQELFRRVLNEAIERWLNRQYAAVGRWTLHGIAAAALAALAYFTFAHGIIKIPS